MSSFIMDFFLNLGICGLYFAFIGTTIVNDYVRGKVWKYSITKYSGEYEIENRKDDDYMIPFAVEFGVLGGLYFMANGMKVPFPFAQSSALATYGALRFWNLNMFINNVCQGMIKRKKEEDLVYKEAQDKFKLLFEQDKEEILQKNKIYFTNMASTVNSKLYEVNVFMQDDSRFDEFIKTIMEFKEEKAMASGDFYDRYDCKVIMEIFFEEYKAFKNYALQKLSINNYIKKVEPSKYELRKTNEDILPEKIVAVAKNQYDSLKKNHNGFLSEIKSINLNSTIEKVTKIKMKQDFEEDYYRKRNSIITEYSISNAIKYK